MEYNFSTLELKSFTGEELVKIEVEEVFFGEIAHVQTGELILLLFTRSRSSGTGEMLNLLIEDLLALHLLLLLLHELRVHLHWDLSEHLGLNLLHHLGW